MPSPPQSEARAGASGHAPKPELDVEELRIAMALNGGVSLAVWMGGCAVELDRTRRASAATKKGHRVYDDLCACFGRRLVIDILSGASAGGINGGLLSAAMVKGRQLDPGFVRDRWLELGDLSKLLHKSSENAPKALMDGEMFHRELRRTFEGILGEDSDAPGFTESRASNPISSIPSLDVTMTDVLGVERRFKDAWGNDLLAREHRPRFKFRESAHFTAEALAAAARTSASFPVAFEPWPVVGNPRVLAGLDKPTFGIDGGLLDNAPIKAALDLIPSMPAGARVRRYVCYLNGDPPEPAIEAVGNSPPSLRQVGGYTINLPRVAPFVDQLYAIQHAVGRPRLADEVQRQLLDLDIEALSKVADALFKAYRQRRTMQSLEELLPEPGDASAFTDLLRRTEGQLPWIPHGLETPSQKSWRWGLRPAQRALHLLLDLLRPAIHETEDEGSLKRLLTARFAIDSQLTELATAREQVTGQETENNPSRFEAETPIDRLRKASSKASERAPEAYAAVVEGTKAFYEVLRTDEDRFPSNTCEALYGVPGATERFNDEMLAHLFRRLLSIEVVRRAFAAESDIESAEELRFIQLTPTAPAPIFTPAPLSGRSPASAAEKLTGVGLGHFAGFYRRSWRANDYMWGRLDAAARIVDLLLDQPSTEVGIGANQSPLQRTKERCEYLVNALVGGEQPAERHWLLEEALADATSVGLADTDETAEDLTAPIEQRLQSRIEAELDAAEDGGGLNQMPFIRAVFQRTAQLEILADELQVIREESAGDRKLGSAAEPLGLGIADGERPDVEAEIQAVRNFYREGSSLPEQLTDPGEATSDLGLRTITHASFVALSGLRAAGMPLSKFFGVVRSPLLAIAGAVAQSRLYRATVVLGFWVAAIYLTSRLVTAGCADPATESCVAEPSFADAWSWATLTALVAALGALGVAAVPGLRAARGVDLLRNVPLTLALVGFAAGFAAILAWVVGDLDSLPKLLFAPGASTPPSAVLLAPPVAMGIVSLARLPLPGWLGKARGLLEALRSGKLLCLPLILTFLLLGGWTGRYLVETFDDSLWQGASVCFALIGALAAAIFTVALWERRLRPQSKSSKK
jgi:predicted acylesterase/phospholipase RssA